MKPININNADAINDALTTQTSPNIRTRTLDHHDITQAAKQAEKQLTDAGIPKRLWTGTRVHINPHRVPNSYGWRDETTTATITRRASGWALVDVQRTRCRTASHGYYAPLATNITLPAIDPQELLAAMLRHHHIDHTPIAS